MTLRAAFLLGQSLAAGVALARLARGRRRRPALAAGGALPAEGEISVVIPARDEAGRIGPCLEGLRGDPEATDVIVVDDRSSDGTSEVARAAGARVVAGAPPPEGWVGKPWALQQGLEAAAGRWLLTLDADTRPRPGLVRAMVAELSAHDIVTAGPRFVCDGAGERLLHPAMLATLVYRFGPVGVDPPRRPERTVGNGQCMAVERERLLAAGGFGLASGNLTDDVALVRALAAAGWRVGFADASELLSVRMHASAGEVWREWGRSLAMVDVTSTRWLIADLAVVWLVMAAPLPRLAAGRGTPLDAVLLALRLALLPSLAGAYERRGAAFWLSPLADGVAAARLTLSVLRPPRTWRGRSYPPSRGRAARRSGSAARSGS